MIVKQLKALEAPTWADKTFGDYLEPSDGDASSKEPHAVGEIYLMSPSKST